MPGENLGIKRSFFFLLPRVWERAEVLGRTVGPMMFLGRAPEAVLCRGYRKS